MLYQNDTPTPLGRLRLSGYVRNGWGIDPPSPMRIYGSYAVACLLRGRGAYRDIRGASSLLQPGDCVVVFPEMAHWYGTAHEGANAVWDEFYITFDGPAFDLWRSAGLIDPARCLLRPGPPRLEAWIGRVETLLAHARRAVTPAERVAPVSAFVGLLQELLTAPPIPEMPDRQLPPETDGAHPLWLTRTHALLDTDLGRDRSLATVAAAVHLAPDTLRKRFQTATGLSPAAYRTQRRIEAAQAILRYRPGATNEELAQTLGFADAFHFSRRFTQIVGVTPRQFRRQLVGVTEPMPADAPAPAAAPDRSAS